MSNMIRVSLAFFGRQRLLAAAIGWVFLTGCDHAPEDKTGAPQPSDQNRLNVAADAIDATPISGSLPAQPLPDAGAVSPTSRVISLEEMPQKFPANGPEPGCFITFAYAGYPPETLIWKREPCSALTVQFMTPADLKKYNDWERLAAVDHRKVLALPDQRVLYVGGEFTASVYPLDINSLTYEVVVSD